jgi:hypothetical protein
MKKISLIFALLLVFNCSKDSDDGPTTPPAPSAVSLTFPDNNQECNQGVEVNVNQSSVTFTWDASANTDSYDVVLKNLDAGTTTTHSSTTNQLAITIDKGTPYSWSVISKSTTSTETAQSDTWKFYNAGAPVTSHAPFPADLVGPNMGANFTGVTSQTLSWLGVDIDNDIVSFDVYFGTVSPPTNLQTNTNSQTLDVTVAGGNTYYWRIVTKDGEGNTSQSEIFEFRVN